MRLSVNGLKWIAGFEGLRLSAYLDGGGVPTIGYGHTRGVKLWQTCTQAQALDWLREDASKAEIAVSRLVGAPINQNQFDALVSLVFNIGKSAFTKSTLLALVNQGNYHAAADQFCRWRFDNGVKVEGLLRRRLKERELFVSPTAEAA